MPANAELPPLGPGEVPLAPAVLVEPPFATAPELAVPAALAPALAFDALPPELPHAAPEAVMANAQALLSSHEIERIEKISLLTSDPRATETCGPVLLSHVPNSPPLSEVLLSSRTTHTLTPSSRASQCESRRAS